MDIPQLRLNDNSLTSRNGAVYTAIFAFIFLEFRTKNNATVSPRRSLKNESLLFGSCVQKIGAKTCDFPPKELCIGLSVTDPVFRGQICLTDTKMTDRTEKRWKCGYLYIIIHTENSYMYLS